MAQTQITITALARNTVEAMPEAQPVDLVDGAGILYGADDQKLLIILENAAAAEKTGAIKAGNGIQGVADLPFILTANGRHCLVVESGRFVNTKGANKGKVLITGIDANVKVGAVLLP